MTTVEPCRDSRFSKTKNWRRTAESRKGTDYLYPAADSRRTGRQGTEQSWQVLRCAGCTMAAGKHNVMNLGNRERDGQSATRGKCYEIRIGMVGAKTQETLESCS